ncbi:S41 family peptidase [Shewanella litorisediminis]|uniref:Peptidase n=1 Tax=Shewanella litorisediminis TaxID=1173586 RepID=A0ABX7G3U4_9GAMM|nr:S41 family peptidase [Shewanella litorisediminis]MCL2919456.1 S41 family peptidase [Shewanella litorisediminis]QRH01933.1 peptidase [Shewanella litorisediminis]
MKTISKTKASKTNLSKLKISAAISALFPLFVAAAEPALPQTAAAWASAARADIEAAFEITRDNHPGMFDPLNPGFGAQLEMARDDALALIPRVTNASSYIAAISRFSTGLQDGHAGAYANIEDADVPQTRWPGFNTVWRGDALWVSYSDLPQLKRGDKVLGCDGKSVDTLFDERVFQFQGQKAQPGHKWNSGHRVLADYGNPFIAPLERCEFDTTKGKLSLTLSWSVRPEAALEALQTDYNGDRLPVGLSWHKDTAWVAMPTFTPDENDTAAYDKLVSELTAQRGKLLQAKTIVLDLRHNQGGSSLWSQRVAKALWGEGRVLRRLEAQGAATEVWWRASPGNTEYVQGIVKELESEGQTEYLPYFTEAADGMAASLRQNEPFFKQKDEVPAMSMAEAMKERPGDIPALTTAVIALVPGQCASACLDALDAFKLFDNTRLFGAPSSADSSYMDIRTVPFPSGLGAVIIPNKMYVNRSRGNGEYYAPDLPYNGLDWTTEALLQAIRHKL